MKYDALLKALNLDSIVGIDFETYYDADYSLKNPKLSTTEYVIDSRFEMQMAAVRWDISKRAEILSPKEFPAFCKVTNWSRTAVLGHHMQFDGLILSHHFGVKPAFYLDTLSMARPAMPVQVGGSLKAITEAFGRPGKRRAQALVDVKGKHLADFTAKELKALALYAGDDIDDTWFIFKKLLPYIPLKDLRLIDSTIKMYAQPTVMIDRDAIQKVLIADVANKKKLVRALKLHKDLAVATEILGSNEQFAEQLRAAGVEPPVKVSIKKSEKAGQDVIVLAMSKQDQEFKDLEGHENKRVRQLMAARFAIKSALMESRCTRLSARAYIGPQPVYLNYYGAKPGRWSGGDLVNWQNLSSKRKEGGAELRASVYAPAGYTFLIADLGQIEARLNAWESKQEDKLEVFRAYDRITGWTTNKKGEPEPIRDGPDIYRYVASGVYGKPPDRISDGERFIGKTCELALGYQAGAPRFARTLRIGAFGPALDITDSLAKDIHTAWRQTNRHQVDNWKISNNNLKSAFLGQQRLTQGVMTYEGTASGAGFIHGPDGMSIRYDGVRANSENGVSYISEYFVGKKGGVRTEYTRLYGGIIVQNKIEHLGFRIISDNMLALCDAIPEGKLVMSTHDEIVMAVPNRWAKRALAAAKRIMTTPPVWAPDLPLAVDAHLSGRYDK